MLKLDRTKKVLVLLVVGFVGLLYVCVYSSKPHSPELTLQRASANVARRTGIREVARSTGIREVTRSTGMREVTRSTSIREVAMSTSIREVTRSTSIREGRLTTHSEEQQQRLQRLVNYCHGLSFQRDQQEFIKRYRYRVNGSNYFYKKYNITYCKVPKVGCTFMVEMFQTLISGKTDNTVIFEAPRWQVHSLTELNRIENVTSSYPTVLASRNPYSRLYSAYVDKILLPNMYSVSQKIKLWEMTDKNTNKSNICANDVTFQQFLDAVIRNATSELFLDLHWAPIASICQPCLADNYMLIKQESFSDDIEDFLRSINVTEATFNDIKTIMTSKRIESTIPGVVGVVFKRGKYLKQCLSSVQLLQKLWTSFQIQGYIKDDREFPLKTSNLAAHQESVEYLSKFIVDEAKMSNLSKEQSRSQRIRYLSRAFRDIDNETIEEIKKLYKFDFLMFDYSMEPPL